MNDNRNNNERTAELLDRISNHLSRRGFLANTAKVSGGALALSAAGGTAAAGGTESGSSDDDSDQNGNDGNGGDGGGEGVSDLDVLNFALTLEHLEAAYYNEFLDEYAEHEVERSDVAAIFANDSLRYSTYQFVQAVRDHEEAHVETLTKTIEDLGGEPVEPVEYDFPYETIEEFAVLSATIEAVGVSAYAGAGPLIENESVLEAALSIHSVEARHTAYFNVLNTTNPFPNAFDEPRTMDEVLEIASQFVVGMDSDGSGNTREEKERDKVGQLSIASARAVTGSGNNPQEEYIEFENTGDEPLDLTGWTVANGRGITYEFPENFTLVPGKTVRLYTGRGTDTSDELYWGKPEEVWNDRLGTIIVRDASGDVALRRSY